MDGRKRKLHNIDNAQRRYETEDDLLNLQKLSYYEVPKLDVFKVPRVDETIAKQDFHSYYPFTLNANNNDTITIEIQSSQIITATSDSYIYIKGTYTPKDATKDFTIVHNAACFFFEEIQYKLGSNHVVDICRQPGITSAIKGSVSYEEQDISALSCTSWNPTNDINFQETFKNNQFACIIPLKHIFGMFEDYTSAIINMSQSLILTRAKSDVNCYKSKDTEVDFKITRISWEVPHVTLGTKADADLSEHLNIQRSLWISFRKWELHELPSLGTSKMQFWRVKNSNQFEKPRWILIALQTKKMDVKDAYPTDFTHANLINLKVYLNTHEFPQQRMNLDFENGDYVVASWNYVRFRESYYGKPPYRCLRDYEEFKSNPVFVIDCNHQPISKKNSGVDIRIDF
ncbi:hypothetical protein ILUMI_20124 [Ignelater luminosus]|uniref:Double jelly roll-like domain-containing protein n=1 Tax=Ignelater luminosus TaxID=2038154 RepID=A0A8K0G4V0_IGNLU|nr:hypothetical protein ILUMI_20124 [Ignelater luminosus]